MDSSPPPPYPGNEKSFIPSASAGGYCPEQYPPLPSYPAYAAGPGYQQHQMPEPPPGPFYPCSPDYSQQQQPPHETHLFISRPVVPSQLEVIESRPQSYVLHLALSCIVFFFCGWLFGFIAFIFAMIAYSTSMSSPQTARLYGRASLSVSMVGIILGLAVGVLMAVLYARVPPTNHQRINEACTYMVSGRCFMTRENISRWDCSNGFYYRDYCYRNEKY